MNLLRFGSRVRFAQSEWVWDVCDTDLVPTNRADFGSWENQRPLTLQSMCQLPKGALTHRGTGHEKAHVPGPE